MKKVIFIRHGQSEANVTVTISTDVDKNPLTALGVSQCEKTAGELGRLKIDSIFSSPVLRAVETADIIARRLMLRPVIDYNLTERGQGTMNNTTFGKNEALDKYTVEEVNSGYPHGLETWEDLKARAKNFMASLPDGITVAVSHKDPICAALANVDGIYDGPLTSINTKIPNASMSIIDVEKWRIEVSGVNELPAGYAIR